MKATFLIGKDMELDMTLPDAEKRGLSALLKGFGVRGHFFHRVNFTSICLPFHRGSSDCKYNLFLCFAPVTSRHHLESGQSSCHGLCMQDTVSSLGSRRSLVSRLQFSAAPAHAAAAKENLLS